MGCQHSRADDDTPNKLNKGKNELKYRRLGRSGLEVSEIGLGANNFGAG